MKHFLSLLLILTLFLCSCSKRTNLITIPDLGKRYDSAEFLVEPQEKKVGEAEAIQIARRFFKDQYGAENAALFTGVDCSYIEPSASGEKLGDFGHYLIRFYYPLGEDGFIKGPSLAIKMTGSGGIKESSSSGGLKDFDLNLLNQFTKEKLKKELMKQLTDRHGDKATDLTIEEARIVQNEEGIFLSVVTDALINIPLSHGGHKSVAFTYHFQTDTWEEPEYCL